LHHIDWQYVVPLVLAVGVIDKRRHAWIPLVHLARLAARLCFGIRGLAIPAAHQAVKLVRAHVEQPFVFFVDLSHRSPTLSVATPPAVYISFLSAVDLYFFDKRQQPRPMSGARAVSANKQILMLFNLQPHV
jgi:hypothetical protein